jgi:hypothetical protein
MNQCPLGPEYSMGLFQYYSKIRRSGINEIGDRLFIGVNDTGD